MNASPEAYYRLLDYHSPTIVYTSRQHKHFHRTISSQNHNHSTISRVIAIRVSTLDYIYGYVHDRTINSRTGGYKIGMLSLLMATVMGNVSLQSHGWPLSVHNCYGTNELIHYRKTFLLRYDLWYLYRPHLGYAWVENLSLLGYNTCIGSGRWSLSQALTDRVISSSASFNTRNWSQISSVRGYHELRSVQHTPLQGESTLSTITVAILTL